MEEPVNRVSICRFILCVVAAFAISQAATPESQLVGKWTEVNGPDKIEFTSAGTFSGSMAYGEGGQESIAGKYFVDGDHISIKLDRDSPMTWKFKISDGDLIVTYEQGGAVKLDGSMAKFHRSR
jgi:uncharacterized protein (DUF2147 family)